MSNLGTWARKLVRAVFFTGGLAGSLAMTATDGPADPQRVEALVSPAPVGAHLPRVTSNVAGEVFLSWVEKRGDADALVFARHDQSSWADSETIAEGTNWFVNWADFPRLSVRGDTQLAHWLQRSGEGRYDYDVMLSFKTASDSDWSPGTVLNTDGVLAEHGFVGMTTMGAKQTLITWLDGRRTKDRPAAGPMTLRGAVYTEAGPAVAEWELDGRVCDCCQTAAAMTARGPVVLYRDRSPEEIRDIAIVRQIDGRWTAPQTVHDDGWQVRGCPVNGPSVSARGEGLAVAWYTGSEDLPKVNLVVSHDAGATFTPPVLVSDANTIGRVDTTILENGDYVVSYLDSDGPNAWIRLARYSPTAEWIESVDVAETVSSRRSGMPDIEAVGNTVYVTWTAVGETTGVEVARVRF